MDFAKKNFRQERLDIINIQNNPKNNKLFIKLIEEYTPLIENEISQCLNIYNRTAYAREDLRQIAISRMWKNILEFNTKGEINFASYNKKFIRWELSNVMRKAVTNKNKALNLSMRLEGHHDIYGENTVEKHLANEEQEEITDLLMQLDDQLTEDEIKLRDMLMKDMPVKHIAKELGCTKPNIYFRRNNLVTKIKLILRKGV